MIGKACIATAVTLMLAGVAFADTPIRPGVTGPGGTGATAADANKGAGAGANGAVLREDGMAVDQADASVAGTTRAAESASRTKSHSAGSAGVGATDRNGATGAIDGIGGSTGVVSDAAANNPGP
jgi:hypothetical protein